MLFKSYLFIFISLSSCRSFLFPKPPIPNVFLEGPFAPVKEQRSLPCGTSGTIPQVVRDSIFTRVGPNPEFKPPGGYHLFDGDGMVHWVSFNESSGASYHNRYISTEKLKTEERAGKSLFVNLGEFSHPFALLKIAYSEFLKFLMFIPNIPRSHMSVANTNVIHHGSKTLALCESGLPYRIEYSADNMETIGVESFDGFLKEFFTAHPKIDPRTGKMYGFCSGGASKIDICVFDRDGVPEYSFPVQMREPTLMHDFSITSDHVIILDMPLMYNMGLLCQGKIPVELDSSQPSRFGVLDIDDRTGSSLKWYEVPGEPFMISHVVNSYYESGVIHLITCDMDRLSLKDVCSSVSILRKTTIDTSTGVVKRTPLIGHTEKSLDFPVINESWTGAKNKYAYVTEFKNGKPGDILKINLITGEIVGSILAKPGEYTGECSFVSDGPGEDKGYIMSFVTCNDDLESKLCIWDARNMKEVGSVMIPSRIPLGFHSCVLKNA